ncbi:MAG: HesA/MoeB/ThiF family protein [Chloroflexia bacterium]
MLGVQGERYCRQAALPQLGWSGQEKLVAATVVVVGCGALGTVSAGLLARAGVGRLRLVDDDRVEFPNLAGQVLFDQRDAREGRPKALAAAERLRAVNPTISVEGQVARLTTANADRLLGDAHIVVDGSDNDATRYLINRVCVKKGIPWVFGAVEQSYGLTMSIVPGETPCFACVFGYRGRRAKEGQEKGVLSAVSHIIAALQVSQAVRLLLGDGEHPKGLFFVDAWSLLLETLEVRSPRRACRVCGQEEAPQNRKA